MYSKGGASYKSFRVTGNVERYLNYKKLHRTGRLLRGLKVKRVKVGTGVNIVLYNTVPYAQVHETGQGAPEKMKPVREPYAKTDTTVLLGGNIQARPFMKPSKMVRRAPARLLNAKMRSFGW